MKQISELQRRSGSVPGTTCRVTRKFSFRLFTALLSLTRSLPYTLPKCRETGRRLGFGLKCLTLSVCVHT